MNDALVNTVPGAQSVDEDALLLIDGVSILIQMIILASTQLSVSNGTLNVTLAGFAIISTGV